MKKNKLLLLLCFLTFIVFLQSCDEDKPLVTSGDITGTVSESGSNEPIEAVLVSLQGRSQSYKTGRDGKFEIKNLPEATYTINVEKYGYLSNKKQVTVIAGKTTNSDFSLEKQVPKLNVSPLSLDFGTETNKLTFSINNNNPSTKLDWQAEKPQEDDWYSLSEMSGKGLAKGEKVVTVTLDRSKMSEAKIYTSNIILSSTNGGGSATVNIKAEKKGAEMIVEPTSLNFGKNETEKTIVVKNGTQIGDIGYTATANESWITIENGSATISGSEVGSIKVSVARLGLTAGNHNGTVVIKSNKNTVTINVSMEVIAKQKPAVTGLQVSSTKYNSIGVSAYLSSVGSAAVSAYGFCWATTPTPTTADNKNDLGGTSTSKSFNATLAGLNPKTQYYIRAYATNQEGTSYSDAIAITTLSPPTLPVVKTLGVDNVAYNKATINGSIDDLGDGYVTAYGFCYSSSNTNPTLTDSRTSIGSIASTGNFTGDIKNLKEQTKYFVRAYATNSMGTSYGGTVELTTPIAPPLVTAGLLAYYTFDNENCKDYLGEENYSGILQGTGEAPTFTTDIPGSTGKAMKCTKGKYYYLPVAPDQSVNEFTYAAWVKTKSTGYIYISHRNMLSLHNNKVRYWNSYSSDAYFNIDLATILFDGKWHHVVITRKTDGRQLYIDGRYYKSGDKYSQPGSTASIGSDYMGLMDNLRIYNRALTQEEIKEIYKAKQ